MFRWFILPFWQQKNLYLAVIRTLVDETSAKFNNFDFADFQNQPLPVMQQRIGEIIKSMNEMFVSSHGVSCTNIFNREVTSGNNSDAAQILRAFAQTLQNHLKTILIIYYTQADLPVNNTDFVIALLFSILKNSRLRDRDFYAADAFETEILKKLVNLVLYQKLC